MISMQYLTYFIKVCETHSMNRAAAELYISQPALSMAIKKLEEELSVTLFVRSNKGIGLTAEGERLLRHSIVLMKQMSLIENIAEGVPEPVLSVSAFPYIVPPDIFVEFKKLPGCGQVRIEYEECRVLKIFENLDSHISQLGIIQFNNYQKKVIEHKVQCYGLSMDIVASIPWAVALGRANPLYERESVSIDELKGFRLIRMKDDLFSFLTGEITLDGVAIGEFPYDNIHSCLLTEYLIRETDAYMFCGMSYPIGRFSPGIRVIPLKNCDVSVSIAVVRQKNHPVDEMEEIFLKLFKDSLIPPL